jgi:branched-chain amino acid aminotransferase
MSGLRVWLDGAVLEGSQASVSPLAHGLHYGTGVFEGVRCYATARGPAVFRLADHLARMKKGADALGMPFDEAAVTEGVLQTLHANDLRSAYVRPLSFYEGGGLGLDVAPLRARHLVAAMPWKSHLGTGPDAGGVRLRTSSFRRNPSSAMPPLKLCGGYVNSILAKLEATRHGFEEALFVDARGFVCEATGENVFMVKGGRVTAVEHPDALPGITRATVMALCGAEARAVTLEELRDADEVFLTGTSAEVAAVSTLDTRDLGVGPVTRELSSLYQAVVHGDAEQGRGWLLHA